MTVAEIITAIKDTFGHLSDAEYLRILQDVHTEFLVDLPITAETITMTALVAETQEYAFDASVVDVWDVRYLRTSTAGDSKQLKPISRDELDSEHGDWLGDESGEPDYYYFTGLNIGLYPKPDTSSSASYPQLSIYVTDSVTLATGSTMPARINAYRAWVDEAVYRIALKEQSEFLQFYEREAKKSKERLYRQLHARTKRLKTKISPKLGGAGIFRA